MLAVMDTTNQWTQWAGSYPLRSADGRYRVQEITTANGLRYIGLVFSGRHPFDATGPARRTIAESCRDCEVHADRCRSQSTRQRPRCEITLSAQEHPNEQ